MANLDNFRGDGEQSIPNCVTTWTVTDTSSGDNDEVTCTKTAEAGKTHFVTFLCTSTDNTSAGAGGDIKATLSGSSSGDKLLFWPMESDGNGAPAFLNFTSPIQFSENENAVFASTMTGSADQVTFTMGGFTNDTRIE